MKFNKKFLMYFLIAIPFLNDGSFLKSYGLNEVAIMLRAAAAVGAFALYYPINKRFAVPELMFFSYEIFSLVNTFLQTGEIMQALQPVLNNTTIFMLYSIGLQKDTKLFIKSQYYAVGLAIYLNVLTVIINGREHGLTNFFFGYYNMHSRFYVIGILIALIYSSAYKKIIGPACLIASMYIAGLILKSGGTLAFLFATAALLLLSMNGKLTLNYYLIWLVPLIFAGILLIVQSEAAIDYVERVSEDAFSRGHSFMSRLSAWRSAVFYISQSPIFGYGTNGDFTASKIGLGHCHNLVLQILFSGGFVSLSLFALTVITSGRYLSKLVSNKLHCATCTAFAGWVIITLVEPYTKPFLMALFPVAFRAPYIDRMLQENSPALKSTSRHSFMRTSYKYRRK